MSRNKKNRRNHQSPGEMSNMISSKVEITRAISPSERKNQVPSKRVKKNNIQQQQHGSTKIVKKENENNKQNDNKQNKSNIATNKDTISASKLRQYRGTADTTPLPPSFHVVPSGSKVLRPSDSQFEDCWKTSYCGFVYQLPSKVEISLQDDFARCFHDLEELYAYDSVQVSKRGGISQTMVLRTLLGEPGSTYKYLGLRLFSHPWSLSSSPQDSQNPDKKGTTDPFTSEWGYSKRIAKALQDMGRLNQILIQKTQHQLDTLPHATDQPMGSCSFTLTLVNKMEPSSIKKDLKRDPLLQSKTSVSWHKDSGLMDFSSIAVYQHLEREDGQKQEEDEPHTQQTSLDSHSSSWRVGLRVASSSSPTPALDVPLPSGSLYYLLDDFNHQHEHTVISGTRHIRYSSTHRVARGQTWQTLRDQCEIIRSHKIITDWSKGAPLSSSWWCPKALRAQQRLWTELEFEWIRQWYVQGQRHANNHGYWHEPIRYMEECWKVLHDVTTFLLSKWESAPEDVLDIWIEAYVERIALRDAWEVRLQDPMYATLEDDLQPMKIPSHSCATTTREDLQQTLLNLRAWKKRKYQGSRTKKEKRTVASNWMALQPLTKQAKRN